MRGERTKRYSGKHQRIGYNPAGWGAVCLCLFLMLICLDSATAQQRWNELEYPPLNSFEKPDLDLFELDNGIRFYLLEDDELPIVNITIMVRTGGVTVPEGMEGLEEVLSEVMRTGGTRSTPAREMQEFLEDRAARLNVSFGFQSASVSLNFLKEDADVLIPLLAELVREPALPEHHIELAKTRMQSMISRRNDDSGQIARREFRRLIYGTNTVYGRIMEYSSLERIGRNDLQQFHEQSFLGSNLMIGVSGDFDTLQMEKILSETFSGLPAGGGESLWFPDILDQPRSGIHFVDKRDVNQSYILLGHLGGMRDNPDYAALQVMNQVLSGGFSGRLFQVVRSEKGLAYAVFGSYGSNFFYPGMFTAGVLTRSEATAEAIEAVLHEIRRLQREMVSDAELKQTRDRFLNSLVFEYASRSQVLRERMQFEYAGMDPDSFDYYVEEVQQVTSEDILRVAREYLKPDQVAILVVGNGEEIGDRLDRFGEVRMIDISIPEAITD